MVSCKMPVGELKAVKYCRDLLAESMFFHALNQRFFKLSRKKDPPYFSCSAVVDVLVCPSEAYTMASSYKEKEHWNQCHRGLLEFVSMGFSDREIAIACALVMSEIESAYLERGQMQSTDLRDEFFEVITQLLFLSFPL